MCVCSMYVEYILLAEGSIKYLSGFEYCNDGPVTLVTLILLQTFDVHYLDLLICLNLLACHVQSKSDMCSAAMGQKKLVLIATHCMAVSL